MYILTLHTHTHTHTHIYIYIVCVHVCKLESLIDGLESKTNILLLLIDYDMSKQIRTGETISD